MLLIQLLFTVSVADSITNSESATDNSLPVAGSKNVFTVIYVYFSYSQDMVARHNVSGNAETCQFQPILYFFAYK